MLGSAEYHTHKILLVNVSYCLKGKEAVVSFNASVFLWKQKPTSEDSRAPLIIGTGIGGFLLLIITAVACICLWRVKAKR